MIPNIDDDLMSDVELEKQPTLTYEVKLDEDRIGNYIDGIEAMKQTIYHIINTERYQYLIYSWNYGIELVDLFGKPITYCYPEIKRRVEEALLQDERISEVYDFEFSYLKGDILVRFKVTTDYGEIKAERKVNVG